LERTCVGLDVHARSVVGCMIDNEAGEIATLRLSPRTESIVGQPPWTAEPGLVHAQHPDRLDELDRAVHDHRTLHRGPRHPMRDSDLGLIAPVINGHR